MSEHFIKNIEIKDFKCFKDFKAEGFGRVNLIGGKNNVGKTAFMESLFIASEDNSKSLLFLNSFIFLEELRGILDSNKTHTIEDAITIFQKFNNLKIATDRFFIKLELIDNMLEPKYFVNGRDTYISLDKAKMTLSKVTFNNFIPSYMIGDDLIINIFDKIKSERKREELNQILNQFDKNILEFDIINNKPQVFLNSRQKFQDVAELGHGLKRYIAIISSILINKNGFLFLDEIENGIHYTNFDKLWELILTISKEQNVQVFATTHSKECIESFRRVANKLNDDEIAFIEMGRDKFDNITAIVLDRNRLNRDLEVGNEVRGW